MDIFTDRSGIMHLYGSGVYFIVQPTADRLFFDSVDTRWLKYKQHKSLTLFKICSVSGI